MCFTTTTTTKDSTVAPSSLQSSKASHGGGTRPTNASIFRGLYIATVFLSWFIVFWILIFPSSWLVGRSSVHDDLLYKYMSEPNQVTSIELVTKYKGHSAVHFSHTLPGAIWAVAIPFQLHPTLRKQYRKLHRIVGYIFVVTSIIMTVGVGIILKRGLLYEESFTDLPPLKVSAAPGIIFMSGWFLVTATVAILQARAKKFASHQRYIIRHIASGIWVALQRVLLLTIFNRPPFTRVQQRAVFGDAAFLAISICFACGELAIYLLDAEHKTLKVKYLQAVVSALVFMSSLDLLLYEGLYLGRLRKGAHTSILIILRAYAR